LAGIYIHIPFCRKACHYCNFHFSTTLQLKPALLEALRMEAGLQKDYLSGEPVETVYFGGGTPSLCTPDELKDILDKIRSVHRVLPGAEFTLEANPDDISGEALAGWAAAGINRLSIGVQSFSDEDLQWMNRVHTAGEAMSGIEKALVFFPDITIDLIYGTPSLTDERWKQNVDRALALGIPHLSCYALTVEPATALEKMIRQHKTPGVDPGSQSRQFRLLMQWLDEAGYEQYEISNFAKPGHRSRHNASYWQGKKYLGLGPSAHSYDGRSRQWNVSNNPAYIRALQAGQVPFEKEVLTPTQQLNETIMTSLRTMEGLDLAGFDKEAAAQLLSLSRKYMNNGLLTIRGNTLVLTREGKIHADGIAAGLFF